MKILMVSMNSIHFRRWSEQLKDSGHDIYWFDILDQGYASSMSWMTQITGWKKGFLKKKGRTFLKTKLPRLYNALVHKYDTKVEEAFEKAIQEIKPDVVHSFALYVSCTPILSVMNAYPDLKWIYSAWGSDLFYFQHELAYLKDIKKVLPRVNYLFTDCDRDHQIAIKYGFSGTYLGCFPGGGGYDIEYIKSFTQPYEQRNMIAVKGYENRSGRAVPVLKALEKISEKLMDYQIVVFGADNDDVFRFRESIIPNITVLGMISHDEVLSLLGKAMIYIGNSNSDGIPNSLYEAICAGAFPIQSNPGGATEEIIKHNKNGLLINDCEHVDKITTFIVQALENKNFMQTAIQYNNEKIVPAIERHKVKSQVLECYNSMRQI